MAKNYSEQLANERDRLKRERDNGQIPDADADAWLDFADHLVAQDKSDSTVRQYLGRLRILSRRADKPLHDMTDAEIQEFFDELASGDHSDVKDDGIKTGQHKYALQSYTNYRPLPFNPDSINAATSDGRNLDPDDLLYQDEVDALLDACGMDIRYKALIAWGLATGQRLDAIRTIRLRHVKLKGNVGEIQLNKEEGALKGASGSVPLLWAKPYVKDWLDNHPHADDDDAALFCPDPRVRAHNGTRSEPGEPLHQDTIRSKLHTLAKRAGIEPGKRVYPHLLRHSAITRMVLEGLPRQQIISLVGWDGDSTQFETYQNLANDLRNDAIREEMGLPTSDSEQAVIGQPTLNQCPKCGDRIRESRDRCTTCGTPLTHDADTEKPNETPDNPVYAALKDAIDERGMDEAGDLLGDAWDQLREEAESGDLDT